MPFGLLTGDLFPQQAISCGDRAKVRTALSPRTNARRQFVNDLLAAHYLIDSKLSPDDATHCFACQGPGQITASETIYDADTLRQPGIAHEIEN